MLVHTCVTWCASNSNWGGGGGYKIICYGAREGILFDDVHLVEMMYLVFGRMPGESYRTSGRVFICLLFTRMPGESYCTSGGVYMYFFYSLACQVRVTVPLVGFTYLVFTCMPGESYRTSGGVYAPCTR